MAEIGKIELRNLKIEDYHELKASMIEAYSELDEVYWKEHHIKKLLSIFPEGQLVVLADGKVVGAALSILVSAEIADKNHTYREITGDYTFKTHDSNGDILYGIDIFIHPGYRGLRLGRRLYDARKELCEQLNLQAIVFAGRIPNYFKYSKTLSPRQYIEKVKSKEVHDPVMSFQLNNDFHPKRILKNYLEGDTRSHEYAVLMVWNNIYFDKSPKLINIRKSIIRLGLIQWQMRPLANLEALFEQAEFFIDAVSVIPVILPFFLNCSPHRSWQITTTSLKQMPLGNSQNMQSP